MKRMSDKQKKKKKREAKDKGEALSVLHQNPLSSFTNRNDASQTSLFKGGSVWTVLAQQIQLHKHSSKSPAISTQPLMWVLIMQRAVRNRDAADAQYSALAPVEQIIAKTCTPIMPCCASVMTAARPFPSSEVDVIRSKRREEQIRPLAPGARSRSVYQC